MGVHYARESDMKAACGQVLQIDTGHSLLRIANIVATNARDDVTCKKCIKRMEDCYLVEN